MNEVLNVKVGDTVLLYMNTWKNVSPIITTVIKITPTGRIRIEHLPSSQFDKYGNMLGRDAWSSAYIEIPTAEKLQEVKEKKFVRKVVNYLRNEVRESDISYKQAVAIMNILKEEGAL